MVKKKVRQAKAPRGVSIEKRPEEVAERISFFWLRFTGTNNSQIFFVGGEKKFY